MGNKLLLHICCANCAIYPIKILKQLNFEITGFWYNPNIHPFSEYQKRIATLGYYAYLENLDVRFLDEYNFENWLKNLGSETKRPQRCLKCYQTRLQQTARFAKKNNFSFFSSTLFYSKHQDHTMMRKIAEQIAQQEGIEFYYFDFRQGWKEGINESKKMKLYRQNYCGCIFSEGERYEE